MIFKRIGLRFLRTSCIGDTGVSFCFSKTTKSVAKGFGFLLLLSRDCIIERLYSRFTKFLGRIPTCPWPLDCGVNKDHVQLFEQSHLLFFESLPVVFDGHNILK